MPLAMLLPVGVPGDSGMGGCKWRRKGASKSSSSHTLRLATVRGCSRGFTVSTIQCSVRGSPTRYSLDRRPG